MTFHKPDQKPEAKIELLPPKWRSLDFDAMSRAASISEAKFKTFFSTRPEATVYEERHEYYIHIRRPGAKILGIAHLDSVRSFTHFHAVSIDGVPTVLTPTLDDRLGVYMLLDWLPANGVVCDILLTTNEERGMSTASLFDNPTKREYNWMFQFDRTGEDVVLYDYEEVPDLQARLREAGFKIGIGSFSDICSLDNLGIAGFNVGCGYENYHSEGAYVPLEVLLRQAERFRKFYEAHKDTPMPYDPATMSKWRKRRGTGGWGVPYTGYDWNATEGYAITPDPNYKPALQGLFDEGDYVWYEGKPHEIMRQTLFTPADQGDISYWIKPAGCPDTDVETSTNATLAYEKHLTVLDIYEAKKLKLDFVEKPANEKVPARPATQTQIVKGTKTLSSFDVHDRVTWLKRDGVFIIVNKEFFDDQWFYHFVPADSALTVADYDTYYAFEDELRRYKASGVELAPRTSKPRFLLGQKVVCPGGIGTIVGAFPTILHKNGSDYRAWRVRLDGTDKDFYYDEMTIVSHYQ